MKFSPMILGATMLIALSGCGTEEIEVPPELPLVENITPTEPIPFESSKVIQAVFHSLLGEDTPFPVQAAPQEALLRELSSEIFTAFQLTELQNLEGDVTNVHTLYNDMVVLETVQKDGRFFSTVLVAILGVPLICVEHSDLNNTVDIIQQRWGDVNMGLGVQPNSAIFGEENVLWLATLTERQDTENWSQIPNDITVIRVYFWDNSVEEYDLIPQSSNILFLDRMPMDYEFLNGEGDEVHGSIHHQN